MWTCQQCGEQTDGSSLCEACVALEDVESYPVYGEPDTYDTPEQAVLRAIQQYYDNPNGEGPKRPPQIVIREEDVNDTLIMNGFVRDVIDVGTEEMVRRQQPEAAAVLRTLFGDLNTFTEHILMQARLFEQRTARGLRRRTAPILFSRVQSDAFYRILDLAESLYGKFVRQWFLSKSKKDWPAWRKIFYEHAWHLGSFVRYGRPAKDPSPWILGLRKPLQGDPFGDTPIGQEKV